MLWLMAFHVKCEVVGTSKAPVADLAAERLGTSVFTNMPCELIRASKSPSASRKMALIWLLTCMDSLVSLQMRTFCVCFSATWKRAEMNSPLLKLGVVLSVILDRRTAWVCDWLLARTIWFGVTSHHGYCDGEGGRSRAEH